MNRLFVGNFSFEQSFEAANQPSRSILQFSSELATVWRSVADDNDFILVSLPEYVAGLNDFEIPELPGQQRPKFVSLSDLKSLKIQEIIPWGWTPQLLKFAADLKVTVHAPDLNVVRHVNTREFSFELNRELQSCLPGEGIARNLGEIMPLIQACHQFSCEAGAAGRDAQVGQRQGGWVVKPNLGQAGRGQIRGFGPFLTEDQFGILLHSLSREKALAIEPLLISEAEFGGQWVVESSGKITFLGLTRLLTDDRGRYCGTGVEQSIGKLIEFPIELADNVENVQRQAVERIARAGYFGPVGIDAMLYRASGQLQVRSLQDINCRWTMGRIGLEWSRRFGESGQWKHAPQAPATDAIALSPQSANGVPFRTRTWWIKNV